MHGRVKVKAPKEIQEERAIEERALANRFKKDLDAAWDKRREKCYNEEALKITGRILLQNGDYQTIWNFRREIILHWREHGIPNKANESENTSKNESVTEDFALTESGDQEGGVIQNDDDQNEEKIEPLKEPEAVDLDMEKIYMDELKFTSSCLIKHPKSYGTWYHRRFIIIAMKNPPFKEEVKACDHFLDLDERNFHCWDYRRFICSYGKIDPQNELQFTHKKISQNFSNFSSFYYRSSLLTLAHMEGLLNIHDYWDADYETISNAIFVDPNDQSPWFYHKWLLAADQYISFQQPEPETLFHKVVLDKTNGFMVYQFLKPLFKPPFKELSIVTKDDQVTTLSNLEWDKMQPISAFIWFHKIETAQDIAVISFQYSQKQFTIDLPALDDESNLSCNIISPLPKVKFSNPHSKLDDQKLHNLMLLLKLEPENKWINLTMSSITGGPDEEVFNKLVEIDPLRRNYYNDQRSKQIVDKKLVDYHHGSKLVLTDLKLTCLYFINHLTNLRFLDLSNNHFSKLSASFNSLVLLETLIMDNNYIGMVDQEFEMLNLKKLSLKNNGIKYFECLEPIKKCRTLKILDLMDNPINQDENSPLPKDLQIIY